MRAPRRKTIAGALFAALFLAAIALAGNNLSRTSTQSAALNVSHMSGPASQFASSTGSTKGTPAAPTKGSNPQGMTVGRSYKNAISPSVRSLGRAHGTGQLQARPELPQLFTGKPLRQANDPVVQNTPVEPEHAVADPELRRHPVPRRELQLRAPDTNGEVGLTQYVQIVNKGFQVFNKTPEPRSSARSRSRASGRASAASARRAASATRSSSTTSSPTAGWSRSSPASVPTDECVAVSTTRDAPARTPGTASTSTTTSSTTRSSASGRTPTT